MVTVRLTGRTRHRLLLRLLRRPLLVLQVEEHHQGYEVLDAHGDSRDVDRHVWRDAEVQDYEGLMRAWGIQVEHRSGDPLGGRP